MISWWWLILAIMIGGLGGMFVMALCAASGGSELRSTIYFLKQDNKNVWQHLMARNREIRDLRTELGEKAEPFEMPKSVKKNDKAIRRVVFA
ncbi:MAG: hypothetical protein HN590_16085 [Calditrichaeota bacterium]|jgi:hypothetical protein|nr:hypothetical protein [Bacteroidota bacterium]MBT4401553.1 hypothetical protein [Bacteroidota bacterium]MBT7618795.1 hypothetical protein [Calditrichota bacterium]